MREEYDILMKKILPQILEDAAHVREVNKMIPVRGSRITLPLEKRSIDAVHYPAKSLHAPLLLGFHGGGFLFGGCALEDDLWVRISEYLDVHVISVDYRMSPEVKDYDSLYDCYDAAVYLKDHAREFGFDPEHISVFGSSAGGNLAAAVCILAKERGEISFDNQILMYPFLDGATDPDSKGSGSFSGVMPYIMNQLHFSPERAADPLLSPSYAEPRMLQGLPKAIISYCEYDNLAAEACAYGKKLQEAGVSTSVFYAAGMPHGYIEFGFKQEMSPMDMQMMGEYADALISSGTLRSRSEETLEFIKTEMIR